MAEYLLISKSEVGEKLTEEEAVARINDEMRLSSKGGVALSGIKNIFAFPKVRMKKN